MSREEIHDTALLDVIAAMDDSCDDSTLRDNFAPPPAWALSANPQSTASRPASPNPQSAIPNPQSTGPQPSSPPHSPKFIWRNRIAKVFLLVGLSLSGFLFWKHFTSPDEPTHPPAPVTESGASDTYIKPIQTVQLGEKSIGTNPLAWQVDDAPEPDPETWREIHFEMTKANGLRLWMEFLWPLDQIESSGAAVGNTIAFDLEEMGAAGTARCTYIGPCPPIQPGPGNVVTGRFKHEAGDAAMVNVLVQGAKEPITSTANHLYWSEDRQDFVEAGELQPGENIWSEFQGVLPIVSVTPAPEVDFLYNLQIHGQHVYEVSELGVLVHNTYERQLRRLLNRSKKLGGHTRRYHIGRNLDFHRARLASNPAIPRSSAFLDDAVAAKTIIPTIKSNQGTIRNWLKNTNAPTLTLNYRGTTTIGTSLARGTSSVQEINTAVVVLRRSSDAKGGWYLLTAYPG